MRHLVPIVVALLLLPATSRAHTVGVSRGEYRTDASTVRADLVFAGTELAATLPDADANADGTLSNDELDRARDRLAAWIVRGVVVAIADGPCPGAVDAMRTTEQDGVRVEAVFRCPEPPAAFSVRLDLLHELSLGHRHLLTTTTPAGTARDVLFEARSTFEPAATVEPTGGVGPSLFRLGVEHILTGYDHLLFLLALVLVAGPLRSVLGMVTAFTLAHSVTLAVAALGVWSPSPRFIEPAIALSVAYVGIENCFAPDIRRRWRLTFLFGLIHGFGFAGALREIAVSAAQLPLALASFNVGVEAGQLGVLAMVLPGVAWIRRRAWSAGGFQAASVAISAVGLCWFVARVAGG